MLAAMVLSGNIITSIIIASDNAMNLAKLLVFISFSLN